MLVEKVPISASRAFEGRSALEHLVVSHSWDEEEEGNLPNIFFFHFDCLCLSGQF